MILANVPVAQTFELHLSILRVLHTIALSIVYDKLLVYIKELSAGLLTSRDIGFLVNALASEFEAILICELPNSF